MLEQCWQHVETGEASLIVETDRTLNADPSRFKELLENLIRDAIGHSNGAVTVTAGALNGGFYSRGLTALAPYLRLACN